MNDLSGYTIGVIRGFIYSKEFDEADFLFKDAANSLESSFLKLINKRVDLIVSSKHVLYQMINLQYPETRKKIQVIAPPLVVNDLYLAIPRAKENNNEIVEIFNNGLNKIKKNGKYQKIIEKAGFHD